jgi:plasmid stabilization system protein ParE
MKPRWALSARDDLFQIADHYDEISVELTDHIMAVIEGAPLILLDHPFAGPPLKNVPLRKWLVRETPFLLLYRVARDRIEIARVLHTASDWRSLR